MKTPSCIDCGHETEHLTADGLCPSCERFNRAIERTEADALKDQDESARERFLRGTPIGARERRRFDREFYDD